MKKASLISKSAGTCLALFLCLALASCSVGKAGNTPAANDSSVKEPSFAFESDDNTDYGEEASKVVKKSVQAMANGLTKVLEDKKTSPDNFRSIMASFVNLDSMDSTSQFGRTISEELMTALNQRGYNIIEVRMGKDLIIENDKGEFLLSRKVKELANRYSANSFIVGTYSVLKGKTIFMNTRLIRAADMEVYAASNDSISLVKYPAFIPMLKDLSLEKSNSTWRGVEKR